MNTEIIKPITVIPVEVEEKSEDVLIKMGKYAIMGRTVHYANMQFQARAQAITKQLIMKPGKLLVLDAENNLKAANKELEILTEDILNITRKFDNIGDQLRTSKNFVKEQIDLAKTDLLAVKSEIEKEKEILQAKKDEMRRIREAIANRINEVDAGWKSIIAVRITDAYTRALDGECPTEDTRAFLEQERAWATEEMFTMKKPQPKPTYVTSEEVETIWTELSSSVQPASYYVSLFHNDLITKFEFYSINLKQKEASKGRALQEQSENLAAIAKEKELAAAGNRLEAIATTHEISQVQTAKGIKKVWEVQMEDTDQAALAIISAFVGNFNICRPGVRVKSMQKLSVEQMASALAWAKNKDEKFSVSGINFVSVDKL